MYDYLVKTYGLRLTMEQLAEVLSVSRGSIYNKISAGTFKIPTYVDGQRWADARDVAAHLDSCRATANLPARTSRPGGR
jgi:predicted DNA-binding transcriptional regulator AlpA